MSNIGVVKTAVEAVRREGGTKKVVARAVQLTLLVLMPGALAGIFTVVFIYLLVYGYYVFTPTDAEQQSVARSLAVGWAPATFFVLAASAAAFLAGHRMGFRPLLLGSLAGVSAAASMQGLVYAEYPPVLPLEVLWYGMLGLGAGLLGGWWGSEEAKRSVAGERALYRAMRSMADAPTAGVVAKALGEMLDGVVPAGVGVWSTTPSKRGEAGNAAGTWLAEDSGLFSPARLVEAAEPSISAWNGPCTVLPETLLEEGRREWVKQGVRSAFVAPLLSLGGESFGLLFIGFRERRWIVGRTRRRVLSAAAGAAMALEKLSVREKEREKDKRLGIMEERERLSREIHDSLIQYLGSIARELDSVEMASEAGAHQMVWQHVGRAHEGARLAGKEARRLVQALRPEILDGSSLPEALTMLAQRLSQGSGIEVTSEVVGRVRRLASDTEHALTRIVQEALSNVRKHSGAAHADILLDYGVNRVALEVVDDGVGLHGKLKSGEAANGGFGMQSMRERTERIGGRLRVESLDGIGTKVTVEVPICDGSYEGYDVR